jgi:hypothetical protein
MEFIICFSNRSLNAIFPLQFGCGKTGIFDLWYSPEQIEALNAAPKGRPLPLHQITTAKDGHYPYTLPANLCIGLHMDLLQWVVFFFLCFQM